MGDVPALSRDLVFRDIVFRLGAANSRPAFPRRVDDVEVIGNLRNEVVDVGVPVAVIGCGEQELRVVVQKHETHVMETAHQVPLVEVAAQQLQERAQPLGTARCQRDDHGQLGNLAQTDSDPAGAFHGRWRGFRNLRLELLERVLQRLLP
jgi:hypothetical protein